MSGKAMLTIVVSRKATKAPAQAIATPALCPRSYIAVAAAELEGRETRAAIERSLAERGLGETLTMFGEMFSRRAKDRPERLGCPVAAAALEREGVESRDAANFAGLVVSTIEGALIRARAAGEEAPLRSAVAGLHQALDSLLARRASS